MKAFCKPRSAEPTPHLLVANCPDPAQLGPVFSQWDPDAVVTVPANAPGGPAKTHAFVSLRTAAAAAAARQALNGAPCAALGGRTLAVSFAEKMEEQDGAGKQQPEPPLVAVRDGAECAVPGLSLHLEFVSPEEECALLAMAGAQEHWQVLARRRVLHFGYHFDYETRGEGAPRAGRPLPPEARAVADRIQQLPGAVAIDQLTINEYASGVGISPHVETHSAFTGAIASLSLGGPAAMVLRREGHQSRAVFLPPRSLLMLTGEARYAWAHYIPHRKSDWVAPAGGAAGEPEVVPRGEKRVSFTFRQARGFPCDCAFPEYCDSQLAPLAPTRAALKRLALEHAAEQQQANGGGSDAGAAAAPSDVLPGSLQHAGQSNAAGSSARSQQPACSNGGPATLQAIAAAAATAAAGAAATPAAAAGREADPSTSAAADSDADFQPAALEARYVHAVYDAIAPHFAATRFAVWPKVRAFLEGLPPWALLADVGCGNGKYFGVRRDAYVLGSDRSAGLAEVAARRLVPGPGTPDRLLADVAVADGLALPYRDASCDGVLCIAVLHHIASPERRLALLAELLRVLRPGGRALVTVWATEQGNMKKVRSWQPVAGDAAAAAAEAAAAGPGAAAMDGSQSSHSAAIGAETGAAGAAGAAANGDEQEGPAAVASGDYFVPWHVPLHRPEAAAAARQASSGASPASAAAGGGQGSCESSGASTEPRGPRLDSSKGAVVWKRFYHLFERGELDALVAQLPGARLVESFYDRDNWCAVFSLP